MELSTTDAELRLFKREMGKSSILHLAAKYDDVEVCNKYTKLMWEIDSSGQTPLQVAAGCGSVGVCKKLLETRWKFGKTSNVWPALYIAYHHNKATTFRKLLDTFLLRHLIYVSPGYSFDSQLATKLVNDHKSRVEIQIDIFPLTFFL